MPGTTSGSNFLTASSRTSEPSVIGRGVPTHEAKAVDGWYGVR